MIITSAWTVARGAPWPLGVTEDKLSGHFNATVVQVEFEYKRTMYSVAKAKLHLAYHVRYFHTNQSLSGGVS